VKRKSYADATVLDDMRIPVRDGITLSARVWMPDAARTAALPALLEILPYRKRDGTAARDATTHAEFSRHDYVCLRVDLRGCGESEGLFDDEYSEQELSDIEDVIAWIAAQPWCSGSVGIMGISWGGFNGLQVAARRPPALKAVISLCSSVDRYADDIHYKGGCQLMENIGWTATATSWFSMPPDPALVGDKWREIWMDRLENTPSMITQWFGHPSRDDYWKHASVCEDYSNIEAAVLIIGGWHDGYRNTPVKLLEGGTSGLVKAIVGPWNHKYPHMATPEPRMDFVSEALRWWDRWLKDLPTEVEDDPDYRVYVMDGIAPERSYATRPGRWIGVPKWPAPQIDTRSLKLGNGTLGEDGIKQPVSVASDVRCGHGFGEFFPFDFGPGELPDDQRNDDALSACFDTEPLTEATRLVGAPRIRVQVSADTPYAQIAARLCDVAPDGASTLISLGVLNLQFRNGFEIAQDLVPGKSYEVTLDLDQAAYEIPEKHRLRLAISASYWPFIWPERGPTKLTLSSGMLDLPLLEDITGLEWQCPQATRTHEPQTRVVRQGREDKRWSDDDGRHTLVIYGDHGEVEHLKHGLRVSSEIRETWSIDQDDISRAQSEIVWRRAISRDDFAASSHIVTKMHSDSEAYHVTLEFKAYDGDECIFEREFREKFWRDLTRQSQQ
jgi:putative CocE/NonD family hydrolase